MCGTGQGAASLMNVGPTAGPLKGRAAPGDPMRRASPSWLDKGKRAGCFLTYLPSGLLQRKEGALREEPVQAGEEAQGLKPGKPERCPRGQASDS